MMNKILLNSFKFSGAYIQKFNYSKVEQKHILKLDSMDISEINNLKENLKQAESNNIIPIFKGLAKYNLTNFIVLSSMCGYALGASTVFDSPSLSQSVCTFGALSLGTWMASASANCFNQISEVKYDRQMIRTKARVLVRNLISIQTAQMIGFSWAIGGSSLLYLGCNPTVSLLGAANILLYVHAYTPLKRISEVNTWVGSVVGAIPPIMGWCAATGSIDPGSFMLSALLYSWQFPHFMALSWMAKKDYEKAGYVMTSSVNPDRSKRVAFRHSILTGLVSIAGIGCKVAYIGPWAGAAMGVTALPANCALIYAAYKFYRSPHDETNQNARKLFFISLVHLPVVMGSFLVITYWEQIANSISYFV